MLIYKQWMQQIQKTENKKRMREGKVAEPSKEVQENESCVLLQKHMRGILARKHVEKMRAEEMEFLGMQRKKKTAQEERDDPIKKMEQTRKERK